MNLWGIIKGLLIQEETDRTKQLSVEVNSSATTGTRTTVQSSQTADRTLNLPDADDTLVGRATTDTLTNKTIDGDDNTFQDIDLPSLKVQAPDAGKFLLRDGLGNVVSGNTVPNGTVVGDTDIQTLENKTIDGTAATGNNTITADMSNMTYDNSTSGLTATDGQAAIDEVEGRVDTVEANKIDGPGTHADNLLLKTDGVDTNDVQVTGISIDDLNNVTGVNDLTVNGNLQVDGTTTSVNSTTLDVTDANITVNNNGNDASAEGAGLTVERTGTDGSLVYEDALASKFKIGALGSEVEVMDVSSSQTVTNKDMSDPTNNVDTASADSLTRLTGNQQVVTIPDTTTPDNIVLEDFQQILTNKDIDGGTASDNNRITLPKADTVTLDGLTDKEGTIAYDTDLQTVVYNDGTNFNPLQAEGQGNINYIDNGNLESNSDGWNEYADASGANPIDGTGGSPANLNISRNTANPLRGIAHLYVTKGAFNEQGSGFSYDFTVDNADVGATLQVSFDYSLTAIIGTTNYQTGDLKVFVYDVDNSTLIGAVENDENGEILSHINPGKTFVANFQSTDSSNYRLIFHVATNNTAAWDFFLDNVKVGPIDNIIAYNSSDLEDRTSYANSNLLPINLGTGSGTYNYYQTQRIGDCLRVRFFFEKDANAGSGGGTVEFPLPDGLSAKADGGTDVKFLSGGTTFGVDHNVSQDTGADQYMATTVRIDDDFNRIRLVRMGTGSLVSGALIFANAEIFVDVVVPIEGWTSTNVISGNKINQETIIAEAGNASGQSIPTNIEVTITNWTEELDNGLAFNPTTGVFTVPIDGNYNLDVVLTYTVNGTGFRQVIVYKNASTILTFNDIDSSPSYNTSPRVSGTFALNKGDTITVVGYQDSGGNLALRTDTRVNRFSIKRVPDFSTYGVVKDRQYFESEVQTLGTISWDATTPGGTVASTYRWVREGNVVDFWFAYDYTGAPAANTFSFFDIPSDLPAPLQESLNSPQSTFAGSAHVGNGGSVGTPASSHFLLNNNRVYVVTNGAVSSNEVHGHIRYITEE